MKLFRSCMYFVAIVGLSLGSVACQVGPSPDNYGQTKQAAKAGGGGKGLCGNFDDDVARLTLNATIATAEEMATLAEACGCLRREIQVIRRNLRTICVGGDITAGSELYNKCMDGYQSMIKTMKEDGQPLVEVARKSGGQPIVEYSCKASDDGQPLVEYFIAIEKKYQDMFNSSLESLKKKCRR